MFAADACTWCEPGSSDDSQQDSTSHADQVKVCFKDDCWGTITNPVPYNQKWVSKGEASPKGCCAFKSGACTWCAPPAQRHKVCVEDNCQGTKTNPIPLGQKWESKGEASPSGCCAFGRGACTWCEPPESSSDQDSTSHTSTPEYECYNYQEGQDDDWCKSAGFPFVMTEGKNDAYPGCGYCWCCKNKSANNYEKDAGMGGWGGYCTCPDGQQYGVGDNNDACGSLACEGGKAGECHDYYGEWSGGKVTCNANIEETLGDSGEDSNDSDDDDDSEVYSSMLMQAASEMTYFEHGLALVGLMTVGFGMYRATCGKGETYKKILEVEGVTRSDSI